MSGMSDLCACGHPKDDHYAGECRHFLSPVSVICSCRAFKPELLVGKHPKPVDGNVAALHD